MEIDPRQHLGRGIVRVMCKSPFYTTIILRHEIMADPCFSSVMGTDGRVLCYNPNLIVQLEPDDLYEILKHEAMHVANRHHIRMAQMKKAHEAKCRELNMDMHKTFNIAGDLAINSILIDASEKVWTDSRFLQEGCIPEQGLFADYPRNKPAEWYFKKLMSDIEKMPKELRDSMAPGGSGSADGSGEKAEVTVIEPGTGTGTVLPAKGDLHKAEQEATEMISRAAMAAKGAGTECGSARGMIVQHEAPAEVNWRIELQSFFTQIVRGRPHYRRPNRRHQDASIIFPSNKTREVSNIALMVDMSGSMDTKSVAAAYTHISEIVRVSRSTKVTLIPFDGKVFEDKVKVFDATNVPIKESDRCRFGCGGTMFIPPLKYVEKREFAGMIMLTDRLPSDSAAFASYRPMIPFLCLSVLKAQFGEYQGGAENRHCKIIEIKP